MEKPGQLPGLRIDTGEIRTLVMVVVVAGECQVGEIVPATVLLGEDVLHVEREERLLGFMKTAVLAASASTLAHEAGRLRVHQRAEDFLRKARAFACRMATKPLTETVAAYSAFSAAERVPSLHFSASLAMRAAAMGSARRRTI